jgi:hypothetical protein
MVFWRNLGRDLFTKCLPLVRGHRLSVDDAVE